MKHEGESEDGVPLVLKLFLFEDEDHDWTNGKNICSGRFVVFASSKEEAFEELEDHLEGNEHKDAILAQIKNDADRWHHWTICEYDARQGVQL
jgi:hypothetical protein